LTIKSIFNHKTFIFFFFGILLLSSSTLIANNYTTTSIPDKTKEVPESSFNSTISGLGAIFPIFDAVCDLNGRPDKDNDGVADENDIDKDNDGILNEDEESFGWFYINAAYLGFIDTTGANGIIDISSEWGLPTGTVIVEFINVHTNFQQGPNLAVSLPEKAPK